MSIVNDWVEVTEITYEVRIIVSGEADSFFVMAHGIADAAGIAAKYIRESYSEPIEYWVESIAVVPGWDKTWIRSKWI